MRAPTALLLAGLAACGAVQKPVAPPAQLRVVAEPDSAVVRINEQFAGAARVLAKRPVRLVPGSFRVTVEAPGYFPHDMDIDLPSGLTTVEIKLREVPP